MTSSDLLRSGVFEPSVESVSFREVRSNGSVPRRLRKLSSSPDNVKSNNLRDRPTPLGENINSTIYFPFFALGAELRKILMELILQKNLNLTEFN